MLKKDMTRFCNLFRESTLEGSRAAARKMRTIAERHITHDDQKFLLGHSLVELIHSDPEKLSWPNKQSTSRDASVRQSQHAVPRGNFAPPLG